MGSMGCYVINVYSFTDMYIPKLLVCNKNGITITGVDMWNIFQTFPVPGARELAGLDLDVQNKRLYASDSKAMKIFSMNLNGSNVKTVRSDCLLVIEINF